MQRSENQEMFVSFGSRWGGGSRECTGGWVPAGSNEADERMLNMHVNSDRGRERESLLPFRCCHRFA